MPRLLTAWVAGFGTGRDGEMEDDVENAGIDQVVPGGWRRAVMGLAIGVVAGLAIGLVLPRDEAPRPRPFSRTAATPRPDASHDLRAPRP